MKLLRRSSGSSPEKASSEISETKDSSDGSPTRVLDFDEMGDKPPGKCVLDVSSIAGNRSVSEDKNRTDRHRTHSRKESKVVDSQEGDPDYSNAKVRQKERSSRNRRRTPEASAPASTDEATEFILEESCGSQQDKQIYAVPDIFGSLTLSNHPRQGQRRNKKSIAPMPTLNEAAREEDESTVGGEVETPEEQSSFESWDETNLSFDTEDPKQEQQQIIQQSPQQERKQMQNSPLPTKKPKSVQPTVTQLLAMDEHKKACERIRKLMADAKAMGAEGREDDSIQTYKKALQVGRADVHRIKAHLRKPSNLSDRFYQDWLEIGVVLSEIRTCQAHLHERLLEYDRAISCIQEAINIYRRQAVFFKSRSKEKTITLTKVIGSLEAIVSRIQTAKKHESMRKQAHQEILQFQRDAAAASSVEKRRGVFQEMESAAEKLKELENKVMGDWHPLVADANSLLGAIVLEQGKIESAVSCMKQALTIMKKALGMKHPRTGTKFLNLATVYASQCQDMLAVENYKTAITVFRSCDSFKLVASTLNDVAVIHIRRKEYPQAVTLLTESLEVYQKEGDNSWDTAQVWRNLGESYCQQKQYESGASALVNALNIQRDGRALYEKAASSNSSANTSSVIHENLPPYHLVEDSSIADTLRRLGKAYFGARQFDFALTHYKEACMIHKAEVKKVVHVSKSRSNLSLPARQDELAQTIYCMAELYDQTGELEQASKLFSESLQLRLFSDAHKESRSNMVHCAMCLYGMGGIHLKLGEHEEAAAVIEQALSYCDAHGISETNVIYIMIQSRLDEANKRLSPPPELDESNLSTEGDEELSPLPSLRDVESLESMAAEAIKARKLDKAATLLTQVMQSRKLLLHASKQKGEKSASLKYDTACTLFTFGQVLTMQGDLASAEKAFKDSLKLFKKSGTSPDSDLVLKLGEALKQVMQQSCSS